MYWFFILFEGGKGKQGEKRQAQGGTEKQRGRWSNTLPGLASAGSCRGRSNVLGPDIPAGDLIAAPDAQHSGRFYRHSIFSFACHICCKWFYLVSVLSSTYFKFALQFLFLKKILIYLKGRAKIVFIYLKSRATGRETQTHPDILRETSGEFCIHWFSPKMPATARSGPGWSPFVCGWSPSIWCTMH